MGSRLLGRVSKLLLGHTLNASTLKPTAWRSAEGGVVNSMRFISRLLIVFFSVASCMLVADLKAQQTEPLTN